MIRSLSTRTVFLFALSIPFVLLCAGCSDSTGPGKRQEPKEPPWEIVSFGAYFSDIWSASPGEYFAVGAMGFIMHYEGGRWRPMEIGPRRNLSAIWGTSRSDIFVVGSSGTILHFDGSIWYSMEGGASNNLIGIWGTRSNNVYAFFHHKLG